jgi:hypothetical protein
MHRTSQKQSENQRIGRIGGLHTVFNKGKRLWTSVDHTFWGSDQEQYGKASGRQDYF